MIVSEQWLREWIQIDLSPQEIAECLTHAGLEVESVQALAGEIESLVIGQVARVTRHPDADRLRLTEVDVGGQHLTIVCGAANVAEGMKVAVAKVGAELPNGLTIKSAKVRGVESNGMLCSAAELGLEESSDGILELGSDAAVGQRVDRYLKLNDHLIDIDLTPNRGDCLSVQGIARELQFLADGKLTVPEIEPVPAVHQQEVEIELSDSGGCPRYLARVVTGVDQGAATPIWMAERLRRGGVRPISPIVDITNYVMLELGQPMHAFDRARLNSKITVRQSQSGERIRLLDDNEAALDHETLLICDDAGPIAIAGVMGSKHSAIDEQTRDIVLEAAHFTRRAVAGRARRYGLHTESSHRFERGVDPRLPEQAMQRATALVLEICGGQAGPICEQSRTDQLKAKPAVEIRLNRLERLLGMSLGRGEVNKILKRIAAEVQDTTTGWRVTPPSYRFDLEYEADLVEEVARVKGYDNIPTAIPHIAPRSIAASEKAVSIRQLRHTLVAREFREAVTYSFVDPQFLSPFSAEAPVKLVNPLAENMAVMRTSLLPGLLQAAQFNHNRQHARIRLFEIGASYHHAQRGQSGANKNFVEKQRLSAVVSGPRRARQWAISEEKDGDFYDIKADLQAILSLSDKQAEVEYRRIEPGFLHPGQAAEVVIASTDHETMPLGILGRLHPQLEQDYGFSSPVYVFELELEPTLTARLPTYAGVPRFPSIRRDLSLLIDRDLPVNELLVTVKQSLGPLLVRSELFDVYQGKGVADNLKSVSIGLTLQDSEQTLTDPQADAAISQVLETVTGKLGAKLRE